MFCRKCGKQIEAGEDFCTSCGAPAESAGEGNRAAIETGDVSAGNASGAKKAKNTVPTKNLFAFMKYGKLAIVAVVVLLLVGAAIWISGYLRAKSWEKPIIADDTVVDVSTLQQQILSIGELATLEYNYKNVVTLKNSHQIIGWNIPLTQKSFIIVYDGTMKIGIDTSDILINASEHTKTISITVPKAKILSHELHEDSVEVLEEKSGLFNPVSITDWATMAVSEKQKMEETVSASDMFTRAQNDAVKMLQALIGGIVPANYTVNVTCKGT